MPSEQYQLICVNTTTSTDFSFVIYNKPPHQTDLISVAWQTAHVPRKPPGSGGILPEAVIKWKQSYGLATCIYDKGSNIYSIKDSIDSVAPGNTYHVTDDGIPSKPIGPAAAELVVFKNDASKSLNLGFNLDSSLALVKNDVAKGHSATFSMFPTYYVSFFEGSVQKGQMIPLGATLVKLEFDDRKSRVATITEPAPGKFKMSIS